MAKLTLDEAAKLLEYTPWYTRYLIRNGLLASELVPIFDGADIKRHMIDEEEIARFKATPRIRSRRKDRRHKFIFYGTPEEYEKVVQATKDAGLNHVAETMMPANTVKSMKFLYDPSENGSGRFIK